ncbi:MAG: PAS domain S-box protein [Acidimicrobiales bacterium]
MTGRRATRHLAALVEQSTQILCKLDFEGTILWCNASMDRVLGFGPGALTGVNISRLVHADDLVLLDQSRRLLAAAVSSSGASPPGSEMSGVEIRARCRDGSWRSLEWTVRIDLARRLIFSAARDVTAEREADEALQADEARLRAILDYSPSSIYVKDLQGRYLIVNREWCRVTGRAGPDVVGATARDTLPADAEAIADHERVLLATGVPQTADQRIETADGMRDFRIVRFLLLDVDGAPYATVGIATDITERTEAERALAGRERLLATVLQASPDVLTLIDRDGVVQQVSAADRDILGHHYGDTPESDLRARVHPDDLDAVAQAFSGMVHGGSSTIQVRHRVEHTDGHWVTLGSRGQAVYDDAGAFAGAVIVSRDMTARITSEQRLRDAREAAERASRTKSEFLSRMSHELRTPLNSILGFAQLLQMDDLPDDQAEATAHILRAGRHLLDLIDEVLDIARIESGHLELTITAVPVAGIVDDAVELTRLMAESAGVEVTVAVAPDTPAAVRADRQRLLQVLLNLLSNAVKYNRPGGHVDLSCRPGDPGTVRVVVVDSGLGINAADAQRVFIPFDRLGAEQSGVEGTGVGLALSQHLVQGMGGRIGFSSEAGLGSTFFVELPTADGAADEIPDGTPALGWSTGAPDADLSGVFRVLLMEDDVANLDLVERVLSRRPGVELLAALHGGLGIELAREHMPDLILVDLHLPDMPGLDVLDRLSDDPATSAIPVAMVGSDAPAPQVRQLLGRGVVGFLAKPFDVRALLSLVDAVRSSRVG